MFERYTEKARRAIFFARYEASQLGWRVINSDCLLLGLVRENQTIAGRWLGMQTEEIREAITRATPIIEDPISTSVDLPLSDEAKRVLGHAAVEADRMSHRHIGTEHLFLGLLQEHETFAARRLKERDIPIEKVRTELAEDAGRPPSRTGPGAPPGYQAVLQLEDGSELATISWRGPMPAIGESLELSSGAGERAVYRILDLRWRMRNIPIEAHSTDIHFYDVSSVQITVRLETP